MGVRSQNVLCLLCLGPMNSPGLYQALCNFVPEAKDLSMSIDAVKVRP